MAAVGLPLLAALLTAPERAFSVAVTLLLAAAAFELVRAAAPQSGVAWAVAAGAAVAALVAAARTLEAVRLWVLLPLLVLALALMLRPASRELRWPSVSWWLLAVLYVGVTGGHWLLLRNLDDGELWVAVGLATTFAADTGSYAVGRLIGRHTLAPALSPGKTWEGAGGGLLAGASAAFAAIALLDPGGVEKVVWAVAGGLPAAAIAGDLVESAIKRRVGVKDISRLIPGHGGLLDRMDSLLLTGPLLYWLLRWLMT